MKCSVCNEEVESCENCFLYFKENDIIFCFQDAGLKGNHYCQDCHIKLQKGKAIV